MLVPDLPGCFSAGDTLDEAIDHAREAIDVWCETVIEDGGDVPVASTLAEHQADPEFAGWVWAVIEVPVERYFGPAEKLTLRMCAKIMVNADFVFLGTLKSAFMPLCSRHVKMLYTSSVLERPTVER